MSDTLKNIKLQHHIDLFKKEVWNMYDPKSLKAEEFIDNEEILESLKYADENKSNVEVIDAILEKAKERKGL